MYKKILVPLDGSELAEKVLSHAAEMALCSGAEILLLRVPVYSYEGGGMATTMPGALPPNLIQETQDVRRQAEAYLVHVRKDLEGRELAVSARIEEGNPAETILRVAREEGADLITMCTHGRTGLSRMVFGSVADQVLRGSEIPVLLIRPGK